MAQTHGGTWIFPAVVVVTAGYYQDYSPRVGQVQFGVFRDVLRATLPSG